MALLNCAPFRNLIDLKMTDCESLEQSLVHQRIEQLMHEDGGKLLSCLIAQLGDFQFAEDVLQDGLEAALIHWQRNGLPRSPSAWLLQVARRKAIDRIRRTNNFNVKQADYQYLLTLDREDAEGEASQEIPDERLRLIFTCCHPALDEKSRTALTLRTLGGLTTEEIARAFIDSEQAMAQRLVRAKRKIKAAAIPYVVPEGDQLSERLATVLNVLYLIFNAGYFASHGSRQIRLDLSNEALRLVNILQTLQPQEPEIEGLLALMLLHDSRRNARQDHTGEMIALEDQDRTLWDQKKINEGITLLYRALRKFHPGSFQIQAAISAVHSEAPSYHQTDWQEIVLLYDELYKLQANAVVQLNKSVALSYSQDPQAGLKILEKIAPELEHYQPFYATRADLYRRDNQLDKARVDYRKAIELVDQPYTKRFLQKRLDEIR